MADKIFDRAFNRVLFDQKRAGERVEAERPLTKAELDARENEALRSEAVPMTTNDAIKRMLLASKDKDYFRSVLHKDESQMKAILQLMQEKHVRFRVLSGAWQSNHTEGASQKLRTPPWNHDAGCLSFLRLIWTPSIAQLGIALPQTCPRHIESCLPWFIQTKTLSPTLEELSRPWTKPTERYATQVHW